MSNQPSLACAITFALSLLARWLILAAIFCGASMRF
jgi:hypothetical protein